MPVDLNRVILSAGIGLPPWCKALPWWIQTLVFVLEEPGPRKEGQPWLGQDLWRMPADGSEAPQRWLASPQKDWSPRWSPDGGTLAFLSKRNNADGDPSSTQIYLTDPLGTEVRQLTRVSADVSGFRWAPDGRSLAFLASQDPVHAAGGPQLSNRPQPLILLTVSETDLTFGSECDRL